jgi:hypothetical protein
VASQFEEGANDPIGGGRQLTSGRGRSETSGGRLGHLNVWFQFQGYVMVFEMSLV